MSWLLLMGLVACQKDPVPVRTVTVLGVVPQSGMYAQDGQAFAKGLAKGLAASDPKDSLRFELKLQDNASQSDSASTLMASSGHPDWLVAGIGAAAPLCAPPAGVRSLWVGEGERPDSAWLAVFPSARQMAETLAVWCRKAPKPVAVLFPANATWAPAIQEHLVHLQDSLVLVPHDGGETVWMREAARVLRDAPSSLILWQPAWQARTFLARPDLAAVLPRLSILAAEDSGRSQGFGMVWEPSPDPDGAETGRWEALGQELSRRIRAASRLPRGATVPFEVPLHL